MSFPKEKLPEFLRELSELTKKYKIAIAGCGCCGSPYICTEWPEDDDFNRCHYRVGKFDGDGYNNLEFVDTPADSAAERN